MKISFGYPQKGGDLKEREEHSAAEEGVKGMRYRDEQCAAGSGGGGLGGRI